MINDELNSFVQLCEKNELSQREIAVITEPLTKTLKRNKLKQRALQLLLFALVVALIYNISTTDLVLWHLSALGRIGLIQFLPLWNWEYLKNERCLIEGFQKIPLTLNCDLCETNNYIDSEYDIKPSELDDHYIKLLKPVIIYNAINDWQIPNNYEFETVPCKLKTNIHAEPADAQTIIDKLPVFRRYFVHYQNCDFEQVKLFRKFAPKPTLLPERLSPIQYSWLVISNDYNVSRYKKIDLIEPIALVGQIIGSNYIRLTPRLKCRVLCTPMTVELEEGELLIVSSLYDLSYRPSPTGENIAIILEIH